MRTLTSAARPFPAATIRAVAPVSRCRAFTSGAAAPPGEADGGAPAAAAPASSRRRAKAASEPCRNACMMASCISAGASTAPRAEADAS